MQKSIYAGFEGAGLGFGFGCQTLGFLARAKRRDKILEKLASAFAEQNVG